MFDGASVDVVAHAVARIRRTLFRRPAKEVELVLSPVSLPFALPVLHRFDGVDAKTPHGDQHGPNRNDEWFCWAYVTTPATLEDRGKNPTAPANLVELVLEQIPKFHDGLPREVLPPSTSQHGHNFWEPDLAALTC
jgi:hypothetical protein